MTMSDELQKLQQLRDAGAIDDEEFAAAKARILNPPSSNPFSSIPMLDSGPLTPEAVDKQTRQWGALLHLSQLLGYSALPIAGLVAPILIWQFKKDQLPQLDEHGRNATNWIISSTIYAVVSAILLLVLIGIPMLFGVLICCLIFPIIAAIKANNGEVWKYPMTIEFLKAPQQRVNPNSATEIAKH